jgi:hypothetical protein
MTLSMLWLAGPAVAAVDPEPSPPPRCFVMKDLELPTCTYANGHWTVSYPSDPAGDATGASSAFVLLLVVGGLVGIGLLAWRVGFTRQLARRSGMNVDEATAMTLLSDEGFEATYLAANLRQAAPAPPAHSTADRLQELQRLRDAGLVTDDEYAARRSAIIAAL